jgi:hypothetical protein
MNILLGDFNAKVGGEAIFKLKIGNESVHKISSDNAVTLVNFATSRSLTVKITMFSFIIVLSHLMIGNLTIRLTIFW